jgi:hypothetical protein
MINQLIAALDGPEPGPRPVTHQVETVKVS